MNKLQQYYKELSTSSVLFLSSEKASLRLKKRIEKKLREEIVSKQNLINKLSSIKKWFNGVPISITKDDEIFEMKDTFNKSPFLVVYQRMISQGQIHQRWEISFWKRHNITRSFIKDLYCKNKKTAELFAMTWITTGRIG